MLESKTNVTENVDSFFSGLPAELSLTVELPSRGKFYSSKSPTATVTPITFEDEKAVLLAKRGNLSPVDIILSRCVKNINIDELLDMDKVYLLFRIRQISIGDDYNIILGCPECQTENKLSVKFSELPISQVPEDYKDPREVLLPKTNKIAIVRFPRNGDKKGETIEDILNNIWRYIIKLGEYSDAVVINKIISDNRFPITDMQLLLREIRGVDFGVQTKVKFSCVECKTLNTMDIPLGEDFLSMS